MMSFATERQEIVETAHVLSLGRTGNLSVRVSKGFLVSPTGIANDELQEDQIVFMNMDGESPADQLTPSSEWRFHRDLYANRQDVNAIIHTHSTYATVLACHQKEIPPFHYMIAEAGGETIRCAGLCNLWYTTVVR